LNHSAREETLRREAAEEEEEEAWGAMGMTVYTVKDEKSKDAIVFH